MKVNTTYYEKCFSIYPDLVDLLTFRKMLGGIGDTFARRLIRENRVKYISKEIFCENRQNLVKQRITPHFLTTDHPNYYEFTTKG